MAPRFPRNLSHELRTPRPATGVFRALRARSVPGSVPENGGCPTECPTGCLRDPSGPGLRSVQKVSRECPQSVKKVSRTLRGHSRDTPELGARRVPETLRGTLRRTPPIFGDTPGDTPRDTSGPTGPKDSYSWPGSSQRMSILSAGGGEVCWLFFPDSGALGWLDDGCCMASNSFESCWCARAPASINGSKHEIRTTTSATKRLHQDADKGGLLRQKNPRVRKISVRNSGAGNGCVNFMDACKKCVLSAGKTHVHKSPRFGGGVFWVLGGGGCRFYFYGRADFSDSSTDNPYLTNFCAPSF